MRGFQQWKWNMLFPQRALGLTAAYGASWRIREPGSRFCSVDSPHCFSGVQVEEVSMTDSIILGSHFLLPGKTPNYLRLAILPRQHRLRISNAIQVKYTCTATSIVWHTVQKGRQALMGGKTKQSIITWNPQQVSYEMLRPRLSFLTSKFPSLPSLVSLVSDHQQSFQERALSSYHQWHSHSFSNQPVFALFCTMPVKRTPPLWLLGE